jgi:hypothetical protein
MKVEEKKAFREQKLKELYDLNEKNAGREVHVRYTDLHNNEKDKQEHLALEYLADKGLITYKMLARNYYMAKITSFGIDYVESQILNEEHNVAE